LTYLQLFFGIELGGSHGPLCHSFHMQLVLCRVLSLLIGCLLVGLCAGSSLRAVGSANATGILEEQCTFDHAPFDALLKKYVTQPTLVDGILSTLFDFEVLLKSDDDCATLGRYIKSMAAFNPGCLTLNGRLAFWANAYNAAILHLTLSDSRARGGKLPSSIKDLGRDGNTVWEREAGVVNGKSMTLEEVLDEARRLGDPRIHAAVNCASLSCPDLKAGAYWESTVQQDFDTQFTAWVRNPSKGVRDFGSGLKVSKIFDWHKEDFPQDLASILAKPLGKAVASIKVSGFLPYVWKLNSASAPAGWSDKGAVKVTPPIKI